MRAKQVLSQLSYSPALLVTGYLKMEYWDSSPLSPLGR